VSQVATAGHGVVDSYETPLTPESWGKLGMWIFLAGDAMSFGALLATYGALRFGAANWPNPADALGIALTAFMTFLLICSSVTMVKALAAMQDGDQDACVRFLAMTVAGGVIFLGLQAYEWTHLINHGMLLAENNFIVDSTGAVVGHFHGQELAAGQMRASGLFGTTFYMTTGFHGMHVFSGVVYLTLVLLKAKRGGYSAEDTNGIEIAGLYWHFVDLVWILVFTFVYLV
jgi:cytochrome c oxidase subunit III